MLCSITPILPFFREDGTLAGMKALLYFLALGTILMGLVGLLGEYQYLTGDTANHSRYQSMHLAVMPPLLLSPVLILFGVCYWWMKPRLSKLDAILLNLSVVPLLLSIVGIVVVSIYF
jgi:hypothetical protein